MKTSPSEVLEKRRSEQAQVNSFGLLLVTAIFSGRNECVFRCLAKGQCLIHHFRLRKPSSISLLATQGHREVGVKQGAMRTMSNLHSFMKTAPRVRASQPFGCINTWRVCVSACTRLITEREDHSSSVRLIRAPLTAEGVSGSVLAHQPPQCLAVVPPRRARVPSGTPERHGRSSLQTRASK